MDMRKYAGEHFIKVDDVRDGPLAVQIALVKQGKFDKPDMIFETGEILSLNTTNTKILMKAYGPNSDDWVGKEIELVLGTVKFNSEPQETVIVNPISPPLAAAAKAAAATPLNLLKLLAHQQSEPARTGDMDDEIPF
jgi:hypothetical protein